MNRPRRRRALFSALACGLLALAVTGPADASLAVPGGPAKGGGFAAAEPSAGSSAFRLAAPQRIADEPPASFLLKRQIPIRPSPKALAVGDFNRDGLKDLAILNSHPATVSILLGLGNGAFGSRRAFPVAANANTIAVADLNGGGKQDLIVGVGSSWSSAGSYRPHAVSVLLGRGDGTFRPSHTYSLGYAEDCPSGVTPTIADLNGDRKPDVVSVEGHKLIVLLGRGDGGLRAARAYPVDAYTGRGIIALALGRLNGDRTPDAVTGSYWSANEPTGDLSVLLGTARGGFGSACTTDTGYLLPWGLALADLNHDGERDLVVAYDRQADVESLPPEYPAIAVSLGRGDGAFPETAGYDVGAARASAFELADFNGDGDLDLLLTFARGLDLLLGNGDGSLQPADRFDTTRRSHGALLAVADFTNDGKPDFAVQSSTARHLDMYLNSSGVTD
jgi:hypothetical protein